MATESFKITIANYGSVRTALIRGTVMNEFSLFIPITETGQDKTKIQYRSDTGWRCPFIFNESFNLHVDISPNGDDTGSLRWHAVPMQWLNNVKPIVTSVRELDVYVAVRSTITNSTSPYTRVTRSI